MVPPNQAPISDVFISSSCSVGANRGDTSSLRPSTSNSSLAGSLSRIRQNHLRTYKLQPHNISPKSILAIANHITLCEGHFQIWLGRIYPYTDRHESVRYWSGGFFYVKDTGVPASTKMLPPLKDRPATETSTWSANPHISDFPEIEKMARWISKLVSSGLSGKDLTMSWFTKRIQPLQHREQLMCSYGGRDDSMCATKDNLSSYSMDKRLRVMIKIPHYVHPHACNHDIYTKGAGPSFDSLEEKNLGFLLQTPLAGTSNPGAVSDAEEHDAAPPAKRKRGAASGSKAKHPREFPSSKTTKKLEKDQLCLKEIDTSNKQGGIEQFFAKSGKVVGAKPQKKKAKPSPALMPITPEVEVPPEPSSSVVPRKEEYVIQINNDVEQTVDSGKGASSSKPAPEEPVKTSADAPPNDASNNLNTRLLHEDMRKVMLEQKSQIERLSKKRRRKTSILLRYSRNASSQVYEISAQLKTLQAEHESLQATLKESQLNETRLKKELETKHEQAMSELNKKPKTSDNRVKTLASKLKADAMEIDNIIFPEDLQAREIESSRGRLQKGGEDTRARDAWRETYNHHFHYANPRTTSTRTVRKQRNTVSLGGKKREAI
ncbi:hypothetical protein QYE76_010864 [Lolium multiflorum]|uniref:Uncharacterized protein n=1 Tax=Lolium multiflorum TaxID=4521 RepID=A0AAD8TY30_LOLMU|nr:hypothetical protein QYE76_010864 [Lolium multiflorum]